MDRKFGLGGSFGVMQGRLSPQSDRGYQVFPWETWQEEFDLAADRCLEHIEWVLDSWRMKENPLIGATATVRNRIEDSGVQVVSVCADYLMDSPLDVGDRTPWDILRPLVEALQEVGAEWLVLPCVDHASLQNPSSLDRFKRAIEPLTKILAGTSIRVSLESDLGPIQFGELLNVLNPEVFGVNYDIGNSASLGYDLDEEFDSFGHRISVVHVKDRFLHGGSVPLGQGDANIHRAIDRLLDLEFTGPVTMQAFRDSDGVTVLDRQLTWFQEQLESRIP